MIKVIVKTTVVRKEVVSTINDTPKSVFSGLGVSTSGSMVNLSGTPLTATDLNSTFAALGVADGSTVSLNCIVKADGAKI